MARKDNRKKKRVLHLAVIFTFTAIVFGTATYAWFIGMRTVNVAPFEVEIAATEDLKLSLDGATWADTVTINSTNYDDPGTPGTYEDNTNTWGGRGLIPMSSIGVINTATSRLTLFEKGSLTATKGGYRLMASRVDNDSTTPDGYVAFDLFIKNSSGAEYYATNDPDNEEAIYLTTNSKVQVGSSGVANTGIENSVRVAFAQIGRVISTTDDETAIQGITCAGGSGVTGICRTAQIWEPNDTAHVADAKHWYDTTCKARSGANTSLDASYSGACGTVVDGQAYPTYAIGKVIDVPTTVDVYDGSAFNGYTADIAANEAQAISTSSEGTNAGAGKYLYAYPYFTDTMKLKRGVDRPTFITLAPNSITKVRVYIYIEGQDIDNYDFASIGKQISVNFGFTKERFTEDDINYQGPKLNQGNGPDADYGATPTSEQHTALVNADKTAPVITLDSSVPANQVIQVTRSDNGTFTNPSVTAITDNVSTYTGSGTSWSVTGNAGIALRVTGVVNPAVEGQYRVLYEVEDEAGNLATEVITVNVVSAATPNNG